MPPVEASPPKETFTEMISSVPAGHWTDWAKTAPSCTSSALSVASGSSQSRAWKPSSDLLVSGPAQSPAFHSLACLLPPDEEVGPQAVAAARTSARSTAVREPADRTVRARSCDDSPVLPVPLIRGRVLPWVIMLLLGCVTWPARHSG